ncbi:MAG: DUF302 domain-containing protein [Paracoccaceae bacterium]|jgi:uncharacterized protein (DUF302 family)|nr:DUF302 domain-containing protein [Paracoccaceae bacterium]MDP7185262.1 DUF302 domain-containing protein [Paracoccaceae bacterium]
MRKFLLTAATILAAGFANAQSAIFYSTSEDFDDVSFSVESAILDRGLVIDNISRVGDMLKRTGADVGSTKELYDAAEVYSFCSASVSRAVMEAHPMNIVYCPYGIFVAQISGSDEVVVGYQQYPENEMQAVEDLLDGIVRDALELD